MKFYVLGPLDVVASTGPVAIRAKRLRSLLAILLLHADQVVPLGRIIDGMWHTKPPHSAVENIRTYIYQLRSVFHRAGSPGRLESHPGGYRLLVDPEELDLLRFTRLADDGRRAVQLRDHASAAILLGEAIALWRGNPLPELDLGPAIRAKTVAIEEQRWQAQLDWINARLALGEHAELMATLRELLGERPLDENLWCCLVTALYSLGRTGEALDAISQARHTFVTELGIEPGPQLRTLQTAVLRGSEVPGAPGAGAAVPERCPPRQLPARPVGFVGRAKELRQFRRLATRPEPAAGGRVPVVLATGPPGVGKSALAVAAATAVGPALPDGQLCVDLRGSSRHPLSPAEAMASLLGGFGLPPEVIPQGLDRRRALYRSLLAERRMLVLLDNAVDAGQVQPLLPGPGGSLVLVTSRRWLAGIEADLHLEIGPLTGDEALRMLGHLIGPHRVAAEPDPAREIVAACERLPAAIRIAGSRLAARPGHPLRILAERLRARDRLLDELSVAGLAIRELLEVSYERLDPAARRCFGALGQLPADQITAAAVGRLLQVSGPVADRQLERLVHEGLLRPGSTHQGTPHYHMPAVLHTYAQERHAAPAGPEPALAQAAA